MAGKKQHFIPQHFLKPFVVPDGGDHLWMYRRGQVSAIRVARRDAAAQNYFYSKPSDDGSPSLDDLVTDYESDLHLKVDEIRCLEIGELIDSAKISEVAAHLMVRSSHVRGTISEAIVTIADSVETLVGGGSGSLFSELPRHVPPESVYRMISEELNNLGITNITPVTENTLIDLLYLAIREKGSDVLDNVLPILAEALEGVRAGAIEMSRQAQVTALGKELAPKERVDELGNLMWHVIRAPAEGAILPDCTSIAFNGRDWQPLLLTGSQELKEVVLALAPNRMAVGKATPDLALDLSRYNKLAADASYSFYIANRKSADLSDLIGKPGRKIRSSFKNSTKNAIDEALAQLLRSSNDRKPIEGELQAAKKSWKSTITEKSQEYFVSFVDFGDEEFAKTIAQKLDSIVVAFPKHYPISSLEGFRFANDYKAELNRNDRGIDSVNEISPIETDEFVGVGMPLAVFSDGLLKTRIVLRAWVAVDLVSYDSACAEEALSVIQHMLASCALRGLIATKFPSQVLNPVDDKFDAFLHEYSSGLFEAYFCASLSARSQEEVDRREKLALMALGNAFDRIIEKRIEYICGGDIEEFFNVAANLSANALLFLAAVFGAYKGLGFPIPRTSPVMSNLAENGLAEWADLFNADLAGFEAGLEEWADFEEMFFVHRHFQRFLAHFGIVPDRHDGEGAYVHVPWIASDVKALANFKDEGSKLA